MFPYADYDFYVSEAHGNLDETTFGAQILEASTFLRYLTMGKSDKEQPEALQYAACAIADMYAKEKKKRQSGEAEMKSENNDGYSVTYALERTEGESFETFLFRKAADIARMYLLPTGLLNRKVSCRHDHKCRYHNL